MDQELEKLLKESPNGFDPVTAIKVTNLFRNVHESVNKLVRDLFLTEICNTGSWRAAGYASWEQFCLEVAGIHKSTAYEIKQNVECIDIDILKPLVEFGVPVRELRRVRALPPASREALIQKIDLKNGQASKKEVAQIIDDLEGQLKQKEKDLAFVENQLRQADQQIAHLKAHPEPKVKPPEYDSVLEALTHRAAGAIGKVCEWIESQTPKPPPRDVRYAMEMVNAAAKSLMEIASYYGRGAEEQ